MYQCNLRELPSARVWNDYHHFIIFLLNIITFFNQFNGKWFKWKLIEFLIQSFFLGLANFNHTVSDSDLRAYKITTDYNDMIEYEPL